MPLSTAQEGAPAAARRAWHRALRDLPDLPYKVETDAEGTLLLSPPKPEHGHSEYDIGRRIERHVRREGRIGVEIAVETTGGVKVPDVAWISSERLSEIAPGVEAYPVAPELCVEVLSDANTEAEMKEKRRLYFEAGAEEVWIADAGRVTFYGPNGPRETSTLAPGFPSDEDTG
ncbi:MAG: Uma2 family endonuclease [Bacteroidetes bacterium QS_1_65_9]|nr:MAG: Uma2 family endonuclease [Bacteroidetes bacterium QS_1_65_9]